jgi:neutral ceramidase
MRRSIAVLLLPLLGAATLLGAGNWRAGAAKVNITPEEPIWLSGFANRNRPSEGVLQPIWVKALALEDETGAVSVVVTSDLQGFSRAMSDQIAGAAATRYKLPRERLLLNASHNHSAPVTNDVLPLYYDLAPEHQAVVDRYTRALPGKVLEAIGAAIANLSPAALSFEQGLAGFAVNRRRSRPNSRHLTGPVDQDVPVLAVRDAASGALKAVLFGYACHTTTLAGYQISGDWAGYAQAAIERRHPSAVALFLNGCGADSNPLPRYHGTDPDLAPYSIELAESYGRILGAAVDLVLHGKMKPVDGALRCAYAMTELPLQQAPSRETLDAAARGSDILRSRHARHLLAVLDRDGKLPSKWPYPVQVWRFGTALNLVALTGEPVVDYSLRCKREYGWENTWVSGYNTDLTAYIPSLRVLKEGGYEGTEGVWEYGIPAPFGWATEEVIAEEVAELFARCSR